jgi:hypothetical protein
LLAVAVKRGELAEKGDEGALAKGVVDVCVERWKSVSAMMGE